LDRWVNIFISFLTSKSNRKKIDMDPIRERQEAEKIFHNRKFSRERKKNYYDLGFKKIIFNSMMRNIGDVEGKKVLEFGCGEGWLTKILASRGAEVWAFDISKEAIRTAQGYLQSKNLQTKVHLSQMTAEKLTYDSNMFDLVVGNAILHHIDLYEGIKQIKRVLRDGGKAYFMEPLGHNPLLNLYRLMTPNKRSKDEAPLRFEQLAIIKESFCKFSHEEYYLTAMLGLFWHFFGMNNIMLKTRDLLFKLDQIILRNFIFLRKYCWYSILEFEK